MIPLRIGKKMGVSIKLNRRKDSSLLCNKIKTESIKKSMRA